MKSTFILSVILFLGYSISAQNANEILEQAIKYHDPDGNWKSLKASLDFEEKRPDGSMKRAHIEIDNSVGYMMVDRNGESISTHHMDSCTIRKGDLTCERASMLRNYYLYLWGLPMKLMDENTPLNMEVGEAEHEGHECHVLRVNYQKDTWYFYLDKDTFQMRTYLFYQDDDETKGEYILLKDEFTVSDMKIPSERSWYTLPDSTFLGTDVLVNSN